MRQFTLALASLTVAAAGLATTPATAQEKYEHGFIRSVEAGVSLQRATEVSAEEALANLPFLPGDRVWTDASGRAAFQFPEGSVLRLDSRSKLDYSAHDESREGRVVLRLWSGSLIIRTRNSMAAIFEIETPGGLVEIAVAGVVRIDVEDGETLLSVYEGEAGIDTGGSRVLVAGGERTWGRYGEAPATPEPFDRNTADAFAVWDADLESREARAARSQRYLPEELAPYAPEFDTHGSWRYEAPVGYVWQPRVAVGWTPYSNGRWAWTSYGWTWVPYEPWGWAPFHYGRWGFRASVGWYWSPGSVWGAAWVSWGVGGGYVGWSPLGLHNRPIVPWHHRGHRSHYGRSIGPRGHRGYAVPRGSVGHGRAWNVVRRGDMGRGNLARHRVDPSGVTGLRMADSIHARPNRAGAAFASNTAVPSVASARPRPGGSSRSSGRASAIPMPRGGFGSSAAAGTRAGATRRSGIGVATSALTGSSARARSRNAPGATAAAVSASRGRPGQARARSTTTSPRGTRSISRGSLPWIGSSARSGASGRAATPSRRSSTPRGALSRSPTRSDSSTRARPRSSAAGRTPSSRIRSGASSRPRGTSSTRPSSGSSRRNGGVSILPFSSPRRGLESGSASASRTRTFSRPSSRSSQSGASSRSRSSSNSISSRRSSRPSRSGSSRSISSRPRSSSSRPSVSSRGGSRSGASRGAVSRSGSSRSGSVGRSSAGRSRGGSRRR